MYGTQARRKNTYREVWFENDVKMYGTQARLGLRRQRVGFENDVKMYGTQAQHCDECDKP